MDDTFFRVLRIEVHMQGKPRRLALESLETRSLLAGNLAVSVSAGSLFITGDDQKNSVSVEQAGPNAFRIIANEGTLINGTGTDQTFTGVTNDINIALKGGWDVVRLAPNPRRCEFLAI